jgi:hypothetical protein
VYGSGRLPQHGLVVALTGWMPLHEWHGCLSFRRVAGVD